MKYVVKRLLQLIPITIGITFISFAFMHMAGGDVITQKIHNSGMAVSREVEEASRQELGLDKPFLIQYLLWLKGASKGASRGDFGRSFVTGKDVFATFAAKLPATLLLAAVSLLVTAMISLPLGLLSAVYKESVLDKAIKTLTFIGNSLPNFFVALLLMYCLSLKLRLLPVMPSGVSFRGVILPALTLAIAMSSKYTRQIRATFLEELGKDYVMAACSRGVPFRRTLISSVLRSSMSTLITLFALSAGSLLGGVAIVESIFLWDGVGRLAVSAISMRDYPIIQAYVIWMSIVYVCVNLAADIVCSIADPRIGDGKP